MCRREASQADLLGLDPRQAQLLTHAMARVHAAPCCVLTWMRVICREPGLKFLGGEWVISSKMFSWERWGSLLRGEKMLVPVARFEAARGEAGCVFRESRELLSLITGSVVCLLNARLP